MNISKVRPKQVQAKQKFSSENIRVGTAHSFAYQAVCADNQTAWRKKPNAFLTNKDVVAYGKIANAKNLPCRQKTFVYACKKVANNFLTSASQELTELHVCNSVKKMYDKEVEKGNAKPSGKPNYVVLVANHAKFLVNTHHGIDSPCPATHNTYLKVWQLSQPQFQDDYILFDEGQDANPVLLSVILNQ